MEGGDATLRELDRAAKLSALRSPSSGRGGGGGGKCDPAGHKACALCGAVVPVSAGDLITTKRASPHLPPPTANCTR